MSMLKAPKSIGQLKWLCGLSGNKNSKKAVSFVSTVNNVVGVP